MMTMNHRMTKLTIAGATALATILFVPNFSSHGAAVGVTPCFAQSGGGAGVGVGVNGNVSGDPGLTGNTSGDAGLKGNTNGDPGLTGNTRSSVNSQGQPGIGGNAGAGASGSVGTGSH